MPIPELVSRGECTRKVNLGSAPRGLMFAKIFSQIFDSSIVENSELRFTFMDMLLLADLNGVVDMTHEAISRRTNRPIDVIRATISELERPDGRSRNPHEEGRRLERLDGHRDWGWQILNYPAYRACRSQEDRREMVGGEAMKVSGKVYYAVHIPLNRVKIGFSINPWARVKELSLGTTDVVIAATERGSLRLEKKRHDQFALFLIDREWFRYEGELKDFVVSLASDRSELRSTTVVLRSSQKKSAEGEADAEAKDVGANGSRTPSLTDSEWLEMLAKDATYEGIDVTREHGKMLNWCSANGKSPTRRRFTNWLNRADRPMKGQNGTHQRPPPRTSRTIGTANERRIGQYDGVGKL